MRSLQALYVVSGAKHKYLIFYYISLNFCLWVVSSAHSPQPKMLSTLLGVCLCVLSTLLRCTLWCSYFQLSPHTWLSLLLLLLNLPTRTTDEHSLLVTSTFLLLLNNFLHSLTFFSHLFFLLLFHRALLPWKCTPEKMETLSHHSHSPLTLKRDAAHRWWRWCHRRWQRMAKHTKKNHCCDLMLTGVPHRWHDNIIFRATSHEKSKNIVNIELRKFVYRIHGSWP